MINELDQRESKVLNFINLKNKENDTISQQNNLNNSPDYKLNILNKEYNNAKSICIDAILGKVYKDALPFDDPKKNCCNSDMNADIHNFIQQRTDGKNSEYYIREAIKRNPTSTVLKGILEGATSIAKAFYNEKAKEINTININDLNFNIDKHENDIDRITKKLELDEVKDIINDNVQKAIKAESDKAKIEDEYNKQLEDNLANDTSVVDDASMEAAIEKMHINTTPKIYQPSLFEAIMIHNTSNMKNQPMSEIFSESVHEYTKLNIVKALKLEEFSYNDVKKLANSYIK